MTAPYPSQESSPTLFKALFLLIAFVIPLLSGCDQENSQKSTATTAPAATESTTSAPQVDYSHIELNIQDISERDHGNVNALTITFSTPIKPDQRFQRYITVTPALPEPSLDKEGRRLFYTGIEPETTYTVEVSKELQATNGSSLAQVSKKTVTTRPITPVVSFDSEGVVMVPGVMESLPITAINVPEADLNLYRVNDRYVSQFFDEYGYYSSHHLEQYLEHQYTARITTGSEKNTRNKRQVDLNKTGKLNQPGVYFVTLARPGAFEFDSKTWFTVSSVGLQLRKYPAHTLVTAQDITTGQLLEGIELSVLDYQSKVITEGKTDSQGSWQFNPDQFRKKPRLILAKKDKQVTALHYQTPPFDLSRFDVGGRPSQAEELFTWSARDIYRPSESITLSVLKRDRDGQPVSGPIKLAITKPDGALFNSWLVESKASGYYEASFTIPSGASVGLWRARVSTPGNDQATSWFNFKVEEFLPERLRLTFNPDTPTAGTGLNSIISGTELRVNVLGEYLYGAPATGNRLDTQLQVKPWGSPFDSLKGYLFGNPAAIIFDRDELASVTLDDQGQTTTALPNTLNLNHWQIPARINLQYSLYETGGRAINRSHSVLLWPRETYIGVKPLFRHNRSASDTTISFNLLRVNHKGEAQASGDARLELYREEEKYFWTYTRTRGWHYQRIENEYLAFTGEAHFSTQEPVTVDLPVEWGRYRLEITDPLSGSKTTYTFFAGENWYANWHTGKDRIRPDRVNLALNQKAYKAGDTAVVRVSAPTNGTAVVMLEGDQVLYTTQVSLKNHVADVEIPLPADLRQHNLYVSAFVVAPTYAHSNKEALHNGQPDQNQGSEAISKIENTEKIAKRSFGIIPLPLNRANRKLTIHIDAPESWRPGQQVSTTVSVLNSQGQPVSGASWLALSAVDAGVNSITGYNIKNPYDFFYDQRQYAGRISDMFDDILEYKLGDKARILWGGDAELTRGGEKPPTKVNIVSLFSGQVKVDQGHARIPLNLPQFEGELQLTAIGFANDQFGMDTDTVKVTSPIVSQLSAPRFLASGDKAELTIDLVNKSGQKQDLATAISVSGPLTMGLPSSNQSSTQPIQLQPDQRGLIHIPVKALESAGTGTIKLHLNYGHESLEREWSIGVRSAFPATYQQDSTVLIKGAQFAFNQKTLEGLSPSTIKAQLRAGPLPDLQAAENWQYLTEYPYTCLEQTASKSFPYTLPEPVNSRPLSAVKIDHHTISEHVQSALNRLEELQQAKGGFGLWSRNAREEEWLTAYTAEFLLDITKAGYTVPDTLIEPAIKRLKYYVNQRSPLISQRWSDTPSHYQLAYKAYAAYLLAREGQITLGPLRDIAEKALPDSLSPLPGIHLGLAMINVGSQSEGEKLIMDALKTIRKPGLFLGDYGSQVRDQALVIYYLLQADILSQQALDQLVSLNTLLLQKKAFSPQERSALLRLAITTEHRIKDDQWQGELKTGGQTLQLQHTGKLIMTLKTFDLNKPVSFINLSDSPLFATFAASGIPKTLNVPVNHGIRVRTTYYQVKKGVATELSHLNQLKTGDIVLTRVRVTARQRVPDALLVSLLPAGLELENQNLSHSLKLEDLRINNDPVVPRARVDYQEFRDDRYVAALNLAKDKEQILFYISRAVNPGKYQVPPARVESMYTPEVNGIGNGSSKLTIVK